MQAELYQTLGGIYEKLGKFDQADSLLRSALDQQRRISGPDSVEAAENLVALGFLRSDQGHYKEAETLIREAIAIDDARPRAMAPRWRKPRGRSEKCSKRRGHTNRQSKCLTKP